MDDLEEAKMEGDVDEWNLLALSLLCLPRPLTETALEEMERDGVEHVVAFSQYPQYRYCCTWYWIMGWIQIPD